MKVLVVDDSVSVRKALERILKGRDSEVVVAGSAEEALQALPSSQPDLVIADVVMPGMDGFELCRSLKAHPTFGQLPILLISGIVDDEVLRRAHDAGAFDIVQKPFTPEDLLPKLENALVVPVQTAAAHQPDTPPETQPSFTADSAPADLAEPAVATPDAAQATSTEPGAEPEPAPPQTDLETAEDETYTALQGQLEPFLDHPAVDAAMLVDAKGRSLAHLGEGVDEASGLAVYCRTLCSIAAILGDHLELPPLETLHLDYQGQSVLITKLSGKASLLLRVNDSSAFSVVRYLIRKHLPDLLAPLP